MRLAVLDVAFLTFGVFTGAYLYVVVGADVALIPLLLLIAGSSLMALVTKPRVEEDITETRGRATAVFTGLAVVCLMAAGLVVKLIPPSVLAVAKTLSVQQSLLLAMLMAIGEEFFFRGFLTHWLSERTAPAVGVIASSIIFTVFHLAVYHMQPQTLAYVFIGGVVLASTYLYSKTLTAPILAHVVNNILALTGV
ncbi:MAG: CPBP family intramembrane metalloprotease [Candidatus Brockarchaeota archaeon]|nr:CPBP family intramembrane metalloprotease [Candidatus Brockarchaeota archaeon]